MKLTLKDFKKRVNKKIPSIFNYEYKSEDGYYKFSIFKMFTPNIHFGVERRQAGEWRVEKPSIVVDSIEKGVEMTNEFLTLLEEQNQ